jgi:iron complex outermembrane receptor protein
MNGKIITKFSLVLLASLFILSISQLKAQNNLVEISGTLLDKDTKAPIDGAVIGVKGTKFSTTSDSTGKFTLKAKLDYPFILEVNFLNYDKQEIEIKDANAKINIEMTSQEITSDVVVVTASRVEESILKSPVAIEKLDIKSIKASPAPTFYDALENVKGVQMTTSSLTFKVPNTRGFNIPNNFRFMQLVDGVDMQAATLGVPLGNAIGPTELDIESVEITPGAASALYGMNAINGMANMITKSPFKYQGLSLYQRLGVNHVDNIGHDAALMGEASIRYAKALNDKLAFKVNGSYMKGVDWISDTRTDQNLQSSNTANPDFPQLSGANNPAYDGWNKYGDEKNNNVTVNAFYQGKEKQFNVRRTGYWEKDLYDPTVRNIKADAALHYKIGNGWEASYGYRIGLLDGTFQRGNKIRMQGVTVQNHRVELRNKNLVWKAYASLENTGKSYNLKPLSDNLDLSNKSNKDWTADFTNELQKDLNNGYDLATAMNLARAAADKGRVEAGTQEFNDLKNTIIGINNWDQASVVPGAPKTGGAWLKQRSNLYHTDIQYNLTDKIKVLDVLVGADYRVYEVLPDGNNFVDFSKPISERNTANGSNVYYTKFGGFVQGTKRVMQERLKLIASLRYDKNLDFKYKLNPRVAAVYTLKEKHNFRASYQNGFRFPSLFEALSYVNNGNVRRVGGLPGVNEGLEYLNNSYTQASVDAFNDAVKSDINNLGFNRSQAALRNKGLLQAADLKATQPEQINSFEVGYKSVVFNNKVVIDWDAYYNIYHGFLGQVEVAVPVSGTVGSDQAALDMVTRDNQTRYRVYSNAKNVYRNYGSSIGLTYNFYKKYTVSGNFNYNDIVANSKKDVFVTGFNTPKFMTNLSFGNREIFKNFGFNVVFRWQAKFKWESPLATGEVPAYYTFDAQVNYRVPSLKATVKLGGTNILNNRYIQYAAGPTIGALYYVSFTFDGLFSGDKK